MFGSWMSQPKGGWNNQPKGWSDGLKGGKDNKGGGKDSKGGSNGGKDAKGGGKDNSKGGKDWVKSRPFNGNCSHCQIYGHRAKVAVTSCFPLLQILT